MSPLEKIVEQLVILARDPREKDVLFKALNELQSLKSHEFNDDEVKLLRGGLWIQAIKAIRTRTGLGLKEAKDMLDLYRAQN